MCVQPLLYRPLTCYFVRALVRPEPGNPPCCIAVYHASLVVIEAGRAAE